jgi:hypothetical protein
MALVVKGRPGRKPDAVTRLLLIIDSPFLLVNTLGIAQVHG